MTKPTGRAQERNKSKDLLAQRRAAEDEVRGGPPRPHPAPTERKDLIAEMRQRLVEAPIGYKPAKRTQVIEELVLGWLRKGYTRKVAAEQAGVDARLVQKWVHAPRPAWRPEGTPSFGEEYTAAMQEGTVILEEEALRRGLDGWDEPVYQGGTLVGHVRKYSDNLLLNTLRARRPEYRTALAPEAGGPLAVHTVNILAVPSGCYVTAEQLKLQTGSVDGSLPVQPPPVENK